MGSGCAAETKPSSIEDDEFAIKMIMPVYYTDEVPTSNDIALAADTWNGIYNDVPQRYHDMKQDSNFKQPSCLSWFYVSFYERLFDVHPLSRQLFTNTVNSQGKFLVMMISSCLKVLDKPEKFKNQMAQLAERHCKIKVKANEYGIVGDVLFWTLRHVLGPELYTVEVERAWVRIYSRMLTEIVPAAMHYERLNPVRSQRNSGLLRSEI